VDGIKDVVDILSLLYGVVYPDVVLMKEHSEHCAPLVTIGTRFKEFPFIYFGRTVTFFIFSPKNLILVDQNDYKKIIQIRDTSSSFIFQID
jgi:hypothetical protein